MYKIIKIKFYNIITLLGLAIISGLLYGSPVQAVPGTEDLPPIVTDGLFTRGYLAEAFDIYEQAGFSRYFEELAWLWTETDKVRSALRGRMAEVSPEIAHQMQFVLLKVLQMNPGQPDALILAGKYHYYHKQKSTALWYFQKAITLKPGYEPAVLSLGDYYLSENNPDKALEVLKGKTTPGAFLRKGVAAMQKGQYHLALGYLLQAELYSGELAAVRNQNLAKVLRNIGDFSRAKTLADLNAPKWPVGQILNQDLRISCAILEKNTQLASKLVEFGRTSFPEYPFWDFYQCLITPLDRQAPLPKLSPEYRAVVYLLQGQAYAKQNHLDEAYQSFSNALKVDRRSLIAYYEAGMIQLKRKKIEAAVKLFSKGLEVNSGFVPLLTKRAMAYEKLGLLIEAEGDRAAIRLALAEPLTPPQFIVSRSETDETGIYLQQPSQKKLGLWYSSNGNDWTFSFWERMAVSKKIGAVWIVPAGSGVSGTAYRINIKKTNANWEPPIVTDNALEFRLPFSSRVIVDELTSYQGCGWMNEAVGRFAKIALNHFDAGLQTFRIWYGLPDGTWLSGLYRVNRIQSESGSGPDFTVTAPKVTNERMIRLNIEIDGKRTDGIRMAVGAAGEPPVWMPVKKVYLYHLSPGDGVKTITVCFSDRMGKVTETRLDVELDTTPPRIKDFNIGQQQFNHYLVSWAVDEPVSPHIRVFTDKGEWHELTVSAQAERFYAMVPDDSLLCQVLSTDRAGNTSVYMDEGLNQQLGLIAPVQFGMPDGTVNTHSRNIQIKPSADGLRWTLSNDLIDWSAWQEGSESVNWRIKATPGWQVVYIKYQSLDSSEEPKTKYASVRVYYKVD